MSIDKIAKPARNYTGAIAFLAKAWGSKAKEKHGFYFFSLAMISEIHALHDWRDKLGFSAGLRSYSNLNKGEVSKLNRFL